MFKINWKYSKQTPSLSICGPAGEIGGHPYRRLEQKKKVFLHEYNSGSANIVASTINYFNQKYMSTIPMVKPSRVNKVI